jgi:hypothetical protein
MFIANPVLYLVIYNKILHLSKRPIFGIDRAGEGRMYNVVNYIFYDVYRGWWWRSG